MSGETLHRVAMERWALLRSGYAGQLVMSQIDVLGSVVDGICATDDNVTIRWNPLRVAQLSDSELREVVVHQVKHWAARA